MKTRTPAGQPKIVQILSLSGSTYFLALHEDGSLSQISIGRTDVVNWTPLFFDIFETEEKQP